jgi:hypothetical protein
MHNLRAAALTLVKMWKENKEGIQGKSLVQILKFAGEGKLADGNACSSEFRELLGALPLAALREYAYQAISSKETDFPDRSFALQDLVNELGKRLGFDVAPGLYRGRVSPATTVYGSILMTNML